MSISDWSSDVCFSDLQILDPNAEMARLVIAGLVGQDHAGVQRFLGPRLPARRLGDALRPFVDGQIGADAVAGAMGIIDPVGPQILPRQNVELAAAGAAGEACGGERDMTFRSEEHTSELQSLMRISYAVFCLNKKK